MDALTILMPAFAMSCSASAKSPSLNTQMSVRAAPGAIW